VTETGAQEFTCRGARHTSSVGMVMAFNPDDPHDGWSATGRGFTYRMVHIGPRLLADVALWALDRAPRAPLFATPVLDDPAVADAVRRLHAALMAQESTLERDERLAAAVAALLRRASRPAQPLSGTAGASRSLAASVREALRADFLSDIGADELARRVGHSRFAVYRAFRSAYRMSPSDYQRQLRLRAARDLIAAGRAPARAAVEAGFADQAHLTRTFLWPDAGRVPARHGPRLT
jgi:AraC-like DNA-binding protein